MSRTDRLRWALYAAVSTLLLLMACLVLGGAAQLTQRSVAPVWWQPTGGPAERLVFDLAIDPTAPGHVWAAQHYAGLQEWAPPTSTWRLLTPSIPPGGDPLPDPSVARAVVVTDEQPSTVYLAAYQSGVFRVRPQANEWSFLFPIDAAGNED